jgi:hypothetical protein
MPFLLLRPLAIFPEKEKKRYRYFKKNAVRFSQEFAVFCRLKS